jgi:hypothetical protein
MIPVAAALGTILQIAGVVGDISQYVDVIQRVTAKGENISQEELDEIIGSLKDRSARIQAADPDRV